MPQVMLYVFFAIVATCVNLLSQEMTSIILTAHYELFVSIFVGTLSGLIVKYLLDKKYIFQYTTETHSKDVVTFIIYSVMGIFTTAIFWLTEYAFDAWFETKIMRYVGAILGLSIGYIAKYYLDKKYVFIER